MNWLEIYKCLGQVQAGLQRLEEIGIPRDRAIAVVGPDRSNDLEIASMIEQLRDLEPKADPAGADGTDNVVVE